MKNLFSADTLLQVFKAKLYRRIFCSLIPAQLTLGLVACSSSDSSEILISKGEETQDFPAVVSLFFKNKQQRIDSDGGKSLNKDGYTFTPDCTGTFISQTVVLTAAHCFDVTEGIVRLNSAEGKQSNKVFVNELFSDEKKQPSNNDSTTQNQGENGPLYVYISVKFDLALIEFTGSQAPAVIPIAPVAPKVGDRVTLVGFGTSDNDPKTGLKRKSHNTVRAIGSVSTESSSSEGRGTKSDGAIAVHETTSAPRGGDSGGPLLNSDHSGILGVVSSDVYVDLNSKESQEFLAKAKAQGFDLGSWHPQGAPNGSVQPGSTPPSPAQNPIGLPPQVSPIVSQVGSNNILPAKTEGCDYTQASKPENKGYGYHQKLGKSCEPLNT